MAPFSSFVRRRIFWIFGLLCFLGGWSGGSRVMSSAITGLDLDQQLPSLKLGGPRESRFEVKSRRVVHLLRRARGKAGW